jgi:aconitate hydratase
MDYLAFTGRETDRVALVEAYAKEQGMWRDADTPDPVFTDTLELDMSSVEPSLAGPKRPQDRVVLSQAASGFEGELAGQFGKADDADTRVAVDGKDHDLGHGDVVIAAITSCTNTSNPSVLVAAGLVARKARAKGLTVKPWVKTSLAPGSQVVTEYLEEAGLQDDLDALGFNLVGYGCTTCIGNSGPLPAPISNAINGNDLVCTSVLSGNRNFEGRVSPDVKANYLASPPLVVAYAIAGSMRIDITKDPIGKDQDGNPVMLADVWPSNAEVAETVASCLTPEMFRERYGDVFAGTEAWQNIKTATGNTYQWNEDSTYVRQPPFFDGNAAGEIADINSANILALLGDSITTDHISPAGAIKADGPAGDYLRGNDVTEADFNSYGSRRGNHEVMMRGTFANIRIRNEMAPGTEGGWTTHVPSGDVMSIYDAAMQYIDAGTPLVVVAGKEYGTGSSRDWAAKGTRQLGVKAVITESYERIHRSNLIGMGVLPLSFKNSETRQSLGLTGKESISLTGLAGGITPGMDVTCTITYEDGSTKETTLLCRIDTGDEVAYYKNGGILQYVMKNLAAA